MGGVISRIFHRKPDDETKPKVKKPRRFGSLRRQRPDEHQTSTRVSRSSTMPSRTQRSTNEEQLPEVSGGRETEEQRLEERRETMRDVMDSDEAVAPVTAQQMAAQLCHTEPTRVPESAPEKNKIENEISGGFIAVHSLSEESSQQIAEANLNNKPVVGAFEAESDEPEILRIEEAELLAQEEAEFTEIKVENHQIELQEEQHPEPLNIQEMNEQSTALVDEVGAEYAEQIKETEHVSFEQPSGQAHEQKEQPLFSQEGSEHLGEYVEHFHAEQAELVEVPHDVMDILHPETAHEQADELPIPQEEVSTVEELVPEKIQETASLWITKQPSNHEDESIVSEEIVEHIEEIRKEDQENYVDHTGISQETSDVQHSETRNQHDDKDEVTIEDVKFRGDQVEAHHEELVEHAHTCQEDEDIQQLEEFQEHEGEVIAPQKDVEHVEESSEEFPSNQVEHAEVIPAISDIQSADQLHEREVENIVTDEGVEHVEETPQDTAGEFYSEPSDIIDKPLETQLLELPNEHVSEVFVSHENAEHATDLSEESHMKCDEPTELPEETLNIWSSEKPREHIEGTIPLKDFECDEETTEEHGEILDIQSSEQPHEDEGDAVIQNEDVEYTGKLPEEFSEELVEHVETPQEILDFQPSEQPHEDEGGAVIQNEDVQHGEPSEELPMEHVEQAEVPQEALEIRPSEQHETEGGLEIQHEHLEHTDGHAEESFTEKTGPTDEDQDVSHDQPFESVVHQEYVEHATEHVKQPNLERADNDETIRQESDSKHGFQLENARGNDENVESQSVLSEHAELEQSPPSFEQQEPTEINGNFHENAEPPVDDIHDSHTYHGEYAENINETAYPEPDHTNGNCNWLDDNSYRPEYSEHLLDEKAEHEQLILNSSEVNESHITPDHPMELRSKELDEKEPEPADGTDNTDTPWTSKLTMNTSHEHELDQHTNDISVNGVENVV